MKASLLKLKHNKNLLKNKNKISHNQYHKLTLDFVTAIP